MKCLPTAHAQIALTVLVAPCAVAACGGLVEGADEAGGNSGAGGAGSGSAAGHGATAGLPGPQRTLDSLTAAELHAVCLEDARRTDPCIEQGMQSVGFFDTDGEARCEEVVAQCRAGSPTSDGKSVCDALRDVSDCPVSVEQYFACVDAWNLTQTCSNAGILIETPEPCAAVSECEDFRFAFEQFGRPPRCDPAEVVETPSDTNDDVYGFDGCYPLPERLVVLGNSVALWGGDNGAAAMLAAYLRENFSPELDYEMHAAAGGDLADLNRQAEEVPGGPGHVAVWVYSFPTEDPAALEFELWQEQIARVLAYFGDVSRFPDGATFLFNTQYSPSDQCPDPPLAIGFTPLTLEEEQMLQSINQRLFVDLAVQRPDTITIDQYADWLGHGWNAGVAGCPHCLEDDTLWQSDPVHPNQAGQAHIFDKWRVAVDRMYACAE